MNEKKISIIVPVYQVESYLRQSVDSILGQTYHNLEVILVDDGSTDKSGEICDEYKSKDSRVKVIHKSNGGLVSARKAGIQVAEGELIGYIDSDDWIDSTMYEDLYRNMLESNADIVVCGHTEEFGDRTEVVRNYVKSGIYQGEYLENNLYKNMLYEPEISRWGVSPACWDKLYRKDLIYELQMGVDDRIWDGEDHAFVYPAMLNSECICITDDVPYHHRIRENSVATGYDQRCFERFSYLFCGLKEKFEKTPYWENISQSFSYEMRWFLLKHIYTELGVSPIDERLYMPSYLFPFEEVPRDAKVIIYGAGLVGQCYYKQIKHCKYCKIVAWLDKGYENSAYAPIVSSPKILSGHLEYDVIVISVENENVAKSIQKDIEALGGKSDKIIWKNPRIK